MASNHRHLTALVLAGIAVLFGVTALLGSVYREVRTGRTRAHLEHGHALAARNDLLAAIDEYRAALLLEPDHVEAQRGLALTLLSLDRLSESESYLNALLADDPTDGVLNRAVARIHAARGRDREARAAYQRAIYGEWPDDAGAARRETRFELVQYLTGLGAREEAIAELLRLKAGLPPTETAAARRVADLLVQHGAPDLAIETLRAAAATAPRDVELLAHLADLQADAGRTADARATLLRAVSLEPARGDLTERLAFIDRVLALDPTLPRLRLVTRTRRARLVLAAVLEQTRACAEAAPDEISKLRVEAERRLRRRTRTNAADAEEELTIAARLWSASPACHLSTPEARALAQVVHRIEAASEAPS